MPTTVAQVFHAAGLNPDGVVRWGTLSPGAGPGVDVVALSNETDSVAAAQAECPLAPTAVNHLLDARPELRLDGRRPSGPELAARLASCWLGDEVIVYIGLAGTSLAGRVSDYYTTPLGARSPHAGGWPLKTLALLDALWVHFATCDDVATAERVMADAFIEGVSAASRKKVCDPDLPLPFANLELPGGARKKHGITGAREPRKKLPASTGTAHGQKPTGLDPQTQRLTAKDISAGQVRVPAQTKPLLPSQRADLKVALRGRLMTARWDPRDGPDRARSGVFRFGRGHLDGLVEVDDVLTVAVNPNGRVELKRMASRQDTKGRAWRGSQCQMQLYVNVPTRRAELDFAVLDALPTLRSAGAVALQWRAPLWQPLFGDDKAFHEYRDGKLLRAIGREELRTALREYWPARGPVWDGVALALAADGGVLGPVLVEAKAYPAELRDTGGGTAAEGERLQRIGQRLQQTREWLGVSESPERSTTWLGELYQSGNRLACLRFFREVVDPEVSAWLLNVYFVNDVTFRPTPRDKWETALAQAKSDLGLAGEVAHSGAVFLNGRPREELVDATGG